MPSLDLDSGSEGLREADAFDDVHFDEPLGDETEAGLSHTDFPEKANYNNEIEDSCEDLEDSSSGLRLFLVVRLEATMYQTVTILRRQIVWKMMLLMNTFFLVVL